MKRAHFYIINLITILDSCHTFNKAYQITDTMFTEVKQLYTSENIQHIQLNTFKTRGWTYRKDKFQQRQN